MRVMYCGLCDVGNTWKKRLVRTLSRTVHFILGHYSWRVNETPRWHYEKKYCALGLCKVSFGERMIAKPKSITGTFATKPRGLYPKTAKIEQRDNKEINENEKANKRRPNN